MGIQANVRIGSILSNYRPVRGARSNDSVDWMRELRKAHLAELMSQFLFLVSDVNPSRTTPARATRIVMSGRECT
jgi:hypothetical protein